MAALTTFNAAVEQVRTLADGGLRVTLDLPEDAIESAAIMMECKRNATYLRVTVERFYPDEPSEETHDE